MSVAGNQHQRAGRLGCTGFEVDAPEIFRSVFVQFQIDNRVCGGCAKSVTKAIHSIDPQAKVDIGLNLKRVTVESGADQCAVAAVLQDAGFPPRRAA
ncbi:heavy-metal-associated domain-containing protein [Jannaschia seosinensis]|uniref:heavy-metal-associated domain-containing protein n=1 Tax=Jannaschia seosinensis TaxID=313367 RepID=UPI001FE15367|nr:heavy-metal-associated domain-containing protein [Jannaschia seosinensis]